MKTFVNRNWPPQIFFFFVSFEISIEVSYTKQQIGKYLSKLRSN